MRTVELKYDETWDLNIFEIGDRKSYVDFDCCAADSVYAALTGQTTEEIQIDATERSIWYSVSLCYHPRRKKTSKLTAYVWDVNGRSWDVAVVGKGAENIIKKMEKLIKEDEKYEARKRNVRKSSSAT